jgi:O-antigen/teichoic acid export membrane protein
LNTPQLARLSWRTFILVNSGTAVAQVALLPVVLLIWPNVIAAAALIAGTSLVATAGQFFFSRRVQPKLLPPRIHGAPTRALVAFGGALVISGLANVPLFNASQFFLARLVSVRQVAYYAVAFTVAGLLSVGPFALSAPLLPALTRARHDRATLERIYGLALRLLALWIPPAAVILFFAARPVLTVWAGPQYGVHSTDPFYVLLVGMILSVLGYPPQSILAAHERTRILARFRVLEILPHLAVTYVLIAAFGLIGAAIAWSLRFTVELIVFSVIAWRLTRLSPRGLLSGGCRHGLALLILTVPPAIAYALGASGPAVLGVALAAAAIHTGYVWRSVLSAAERERVAKSMQRILPALPAR